MVVSENLFMKQTVVAVFEDDKNDRFIYSRIFNHSTKPPKVFIFSDPAEGIEKAREVKFDMVYIDLHFWQNFGGSWILEKLKNICPAGMIAFAMTPFIQKGDLERTLASGFDLCLEKSMLFNNSDCVQFW